MKKIFLFLFISILFCKTILAQNDTIVSVQYFSTLPKISIRALEVVNETKVWFAANRGVWGFTEDGGKNFYIDSIKADTVYPQFRSIAVLNDSTVLLLSIASPAYLFKTTNKGKSWKLVYKNTDSTIFFDCMKFYDQQHGIAIADPIDNCIQVIETKNAGETWQKVECVNLPATETDESFFAASNTNIAIKEKHIWFATGGKRSRVVHSSDLGKHYISYNSPLPQGEKMTGIYSIDFYNKKIGAIAGGNYDKKDDASIATIAITHNAGKTFKIIKTPQPAFGSCVKFRTINELFITGLNGTFRCNINSKKVVELKDTLKASLVFNTFGFSPSCKALWLAGSNGTLAKIRLKE